MMPQWIIEKKRDGAVLAPGEIGFFMRGYAAGAIPDYQMAALAMAIAIRGMTLEETSALTAAMLESGALIDSSPVSRPRIDKHSTGGVGDKISLVLAPLVACCGLAAPMIVGRGLGITGGTLDKLESIPGFRTVLTDDEFVGVVRECGCAIMGASERIAPADKKLYALRDVTGTVESIPLIAASILSKKLAAGLDGIVFDVKWGAGAFMKTRCSARQLAETLVKVSRLMKLPARALITDMNQPLGMAVGNALEVEEAVAILQGANQADVIELTLRLGERMLMLTGRFKSGAAARAALLAKLRSGEAFERFRTMVRLQGGAANRIAKRICGPAKCAYYRAPAAGHVQALDAGLIGRSAILLGAGRSKLGDKIDRSAGILCVKKIGARVRRGELLALMFAQSKECFPAARKLVAEAYRIGKKYVKPPRLMVEEIV